MIRFTPTVRPICIALLAIMVTSAVAFPVLIGQLEIYLRKEPVPLQSALDSLPTRLGRWTRRGDDYEMTATMTEELGTDKHLTRVYRNASGDELTVHLAYYTGGIDDVPHVPERCFNAAGLTTLGATVVEPLELEFEGAVPTEIVNVKTGDRYDRISTRHPVLGMIDVHLPIGEAEISVVEAKDPKNQRVTHVGGYFFIANNRYAARASGVKSIAYDPQERAAYYLKVQVTFQTKAGADEATRQYLPIVEDLLDELVPEVMQILPDWPTIEAGQREGAEAVANRIQDRQLVGSDFDKVRSPHS
ncbi:MAG: exosortase-associated EpsI family protein [Phycisphaerales bacterium]|nr:exosortase-associated EpsI family protein [Phycisphaerales bacterium]